MLKTSKSETNCNVTREKISHRALGPRFTGTKCKEERKRSIKKAKEENIKKAAVCSMYLHQRTKSYCSPSPVTSPAVQTLPTPVSPRAADNDDDITISKATGRSMSFAHRPGRTKREVARTNSCLARYIALDPHMSVREEIRWARRSIKLYREFSQLSTFQTFQHYFKQINLSECEPGVLG
eukprot:sb/3471621/